MQRCGRLFLLLRQQSVPAPAPAPARGLHAMAPRCTSLAATFNSSTALPGLSRLRSRRPDPSEDRGLFLIPQLTSPEGFSQLRSECALRSAELVREACDPDRKRIVAAVFDDLSDELCRVADMAEFVRVAHPDAPVRGAAEEACIHVSGMVEQLNTHLGLYGALKAAVDGGERFTQTEVDRHVAKLFLLDFQQSGIHLDDEARQVVVRLTDYVLQLGQQFSAGAHRACTVKSSLVPASVRRLFQVEGDQVVLNGLHVDSRYDLARETAHMLYYRHDPGQEDLLSELLSHRAHLAHLCGYKTFAHRALAESLAGTPDSVGAFLRRLSAELRPRVEEDFAWLLELKRRANPSAERLEVWDVPYYSSQAKSSLFDLPDAVSEYFSLGVCMEGLNTIFETIFGVELVVETAEPGEVWHPDVYKLAVREAGGGDLLGHIYCDFFTRPGKPHQDCHFTIRGGRRRSDGSYQNPAVVLMLSLPAATWGAPTLLGGPAVDNLFHEMGHAMHSMLGRTDYQHVTGTRCSTDFAEVPSTLMEYFASDPSVLCRIGRHYKTGQPLPEDVARRFCASKKAFSAVDVHTQLFYSLVDQEFHSEGGVSSPTALTVERLHRLHHPLPYHPEVAWHHRFSHLVGYGARYYSYLMARAVAASIWSALFAGDPLDGSAGARYRRECLAHGGGKPSAKIVSDLLGVKSASLLTDAVVAEVDAAAVAVKNLVKH